MYTHNKLYMTAGKAPEDAAGALIMIHGRGGTAEDITRLARELNVGELAIYAPRASNNSWYPYSFMSSEEQNQPALGSALQRIDELVEQVVKDGIPYDKIWFLGFSQGACLTLEYVARNAKRYAGVTAFTGGLIGPELVIQRYSGDFSGTPVLLSTGDPDPHVPLSRVEESASVLENLGARVKLEVFKGRPHTISAAEIRLANEFVFMK